MPKDNNPQGLREVEPAIPGMETFRVEAGSGTPVDPRGRQVSALDLVAIDLWTKFLNALEPRGIFGLFGGSAAADACRAAFEQTPGDSILRSVLIPPNEGELAAMRRVRNVNERSSQPDINDEAVIAAYFRRNDAARARFVSDNARLEARNSAIDLVRQGRIRTVEEFGQSILPDPAGTRRAARSERA